MTVQLDKLKSNIEKTCSNCKKKIYAGDDYYLYNRIYSRTPENGIWCDGCKKKAEKRGIHFA